MVVVSDTAPITTLLAIQQCALLQQLYTEVIIPAEVQRELLRFHSVLPEFLKVRVIQYPATVQQFSEDVDPGEAEAIILALELKADTLLIDDQAGRRAALEMGLKITGLLGVLVKAKEQALIPSVRDMLVRIETETKFFISEELRNETLQLAREL
jgi:predicted nucleic acid-binding protein